MNPYPLEIEKPIVNGLKDVELFEQGAPYRERYPLRSSYEVFHYAAEHYGDDPALRFLLTAERDETPADTSFKQLLERIHQTANALHALGIGPADTVSVMLANVPHSHYAIWGAQAAAISSPVNPLLESRQLIEIMNATQAKVLITAAPLLANPEHWQKVQAVAARVPTLETVLTVTIDGYTEATAQLDHENIRIENFDKLIAAQPGERLVSGRQINGDDLASYFHTGGTTGHPKIAMVTHDNIAFVSQVIRHLTAYRERSAVLSCLPLFHIYGLIAAGIGTLHSGRTLVMMTPDGFRNENVVRHWWHHVGRFGVTSFGSVPTILAALMEVPVGDADLSCLKDVGCGAAPLPKKLRADFQEKFNVRVTNGYGMTESTCIMTRQRAEQPGPPGSVGTRYPYTQIRIVELDGNKVVRDCPPNQSGVLIVKGPHIFKGYLDPGDNAKAWADGDWFNTGDVGFADEDGWITLTGRAKDLIIRGGHNIDPIVIEEPLQKHEAVAEVVAIGQPDPYAGEIPIVFVRLKSDYKGKVTADDLIVYAKEHISERAAVPKRVEIVDEFPVTAVGKFFKPALRSQATKTVLSECLQELGIRGEVDAFVDPARGQVARVKLHDASQLEAARTELERYPVVIELVA